MRWLVLLAVVGCYRSEPANPAAPARPAVVPAEARYARTAADPLGFLPSDAQVVAHLDVAQLRQSALWSRLEPKLMEKAADTLGKFRATCGFDPLSRIHSMAIAMRGLDTPQQGGVIVIRGVPRAEMMPCVEKEVARQPAVGTIDRHRVVTVRGAANEPPVVFAYADARTLVITLGHGSSPQLLRDTLDGGTPLRLSDTFMAMFVRIDPRRSGWFFMNGGSQLFDTASAMGMRPHGIFGSVDVTSGLAAKVVLRMPGPAEAQNLVAMAQSQLAAVQALVAKLDIAAEDADVVIDVALTDDQMTMLANLLGP